MLQNYCVGFHSPFSPFGGKIIGGDYGFGCASGEDRGFGVGLGLRLSQLAGEP